MALYLKFPGTIPPSSTLREAANNQDVPFDPQGIVAPAGAPRYVGYGDGSTSDLTDTELNDLIANIESMTGLNIEGAYDSAPAP